MKHRTASMCDHGCPPRTDVRVQRRFLRSSCLPDSHDACSWPNKRATKPFWRALPTEALRGPAGRAMAHRWHSVVAAPMLLLLLRHLLRKDLQMLLPGCCCHHTSLMSPHCNRRTARGGVHP